MSFSGWLLPCFLGEAQAGIQTQMMGMGGLQKDNVLKGAEERVASAVSTCRVCGFNVLCLHFQRVVSAVSTCRVCSFNVSRVFPSLGVRKEASGTASLFFQLSIVNHHSSQSSQLPTPGASASPWLPPP